MKFPDLDAGLLGPDGLVDLRDVVSLLMAAGISQSMDSGREDAPATRVGPDEDVGLYGVDATLAGPEMSDSPS